MRLGFNGATTQTADLATDIRIAGRAGYNVIELRDDKLDHFLTHGSLDDVRRLLRAAAACRPEGISTGVEPVTKDDEGRRPS